jgi:uncharacterized protein DUF3435
MLFRIRAFKNFSTDGLVVDYPENLYNLGVLKGLGQQELKLKDEILDQFVFYLGCRWVSDCPRGTANRGNAAIPYETGGV